MKLTKQEIKQIETMADIELEKEIRDMVSMIEKRKKVVVYGRPKEEENKNIIKKGKRVVDDKRR